MNDRDDEHLSPDQRAILNAAEAAARRLGPALVEWMDTPDWAASEAYLRAHADELVTADGEAAMSVFQLANRHVDAVHVHAWLLRLCRDRGIAAAYAALREELAEDSRLDASAPAPTDLLIEWVEAPDWDASQTLMEVCAADLLTDEAEGRLAARAAAEPESRVLATHLTLLRRCRKLGIPAAYAELRALVDDPLDSALSALLRADSAKALARALADHPVLGELRAVERMAAFARQARAAGPAQVATQALYIATVLADAYLRGGAPAAEPYDRAAFAATVAALTDLAETLEDPYLAGELRAILAECNRLG